MSTDIHDDSAVGRFGLDGLGPPPSAFVRIVMRRMTKMFNPLVRRLAGRRHVNMAAKIYHRGRRSGRQYVTPVTVRRSGGHFFVALTFGRGSDWCKNVRAAGECMIRWRGHDYHAVNPVLMERAAGLQAADGAIRRHERVMMRAFGIKEFLRLDVVDPS
jgi:deazaflavin-dependent oxidoreductase (nitroreductase family)